MRDSDTYQAILDEGEIKGLQRAVLRMGRKHLGEPGDEAQAAVRAITDGERLER